eukprot:scaffold57176_cov43-Prasinocladus_malaysianus.AAC.2
METQVRIQAVAPPLHEFADLVEPCLSCVQRSLMPGGSGDPEKDEADEARETAKRFAKKFEFVPEAQPEEALVGDRFADRGDLDRGERWDCESVLSLRSNLDNHPGRIDEPRRKTRPTAGK